MPMTASLARVVADVPDIYHLRFHPGGGGYGSFYDGIATVAVTGEEAEITGLVIQGGRFTPAHWEVARGVLQGIGVKWAAWERRNMPAARSKRHPV